VDYDSCHFLVYSTPQDHNTPILHLNRNWLNWMIPQLKQIWINAGFSSLNLLLSTKTNEVYCLINQPIPFKNLCVQLCHIKVYGWSHTMVLAKADMNVCSCMQNSWRRQNKIFPALQRFVFYSFHWFTLKTIQNCCCIIIVHNFNCENSERKNSHFSINQKHKITSYILIKLCETWKNIKFTASVTMDNAIYF
jgi:hypothetical protein